MKKVHLLVISLVFFQIVAANAALDSTDPLESGFASPPESAKPHIWWHWMNGNVTKEGITADLESMQRVGIGGAQIFNAGEGIPAGPVKFNSPEWHEMFTFAGQEANRLGLELGLHNCAGWSSSGGPWNTPGHSMQHVTISETKIAGGQKFAGILPQPPTTWDYYRDIAVLAFPTPDGEGTRMKQLAPKMTASDSHFNGAPVPDGKRDTSASLPINQMPQFVQLEFTRPFATRSVTLGFSQGSGGLKGVLQVSDNGQKFRTLRSFMTPNRPTRRLSLTLGDTAVSGRFFRIQFNGITTRTKELVVTLIDLSPRLRLENVDAKDGDSGAFVDSPPAEGPTSESLLVKEGDIVDLTGRMDADGHLAWDAPAGDWTILRLGYTPYGRENHPAPPEGTGPECDKFTPEALDAHWAGFVQKAIDDLGPLAGPGKTFDNVLIDSYEVGGQNWSVDFREEFKKRRGYDPVKFLPTFTGRVVDSPEASERFLWDMRRTISDLFAEKYYGHFTELCHAHGMKAAFEPYTGPYESLQVGASADLPMGEFWAGSSTPDQSVKLASSIGHIYGRNIIGTESFTAAPGAHSRWLDDPYSLKALGDQVFCTGINRMTFHRFAMQPWTNRWPGMTMGQWGTHFDRTSTWWEQGRAWIQYLTRSQFLLQQGHFVADAAYFDGEDAPNEMPSIDPALPPGYDFDALGALALEDATVQNGQLLLNSGMKYRVLVLPSSVRTMTPQVLEKIHALVADGLTLVGAPPESSPSLEDYPRCDAEVKSLGHDLWGHCDGKTVTKHRFKNGTVIWGQPLAQVLANLNTPPDFVFSDTQHSRLSFIHRSDGEADIYFISNQRDHFDTVDGTFRVGGKTPEFWHADTGVIEPAPIWHEENGLTTVPLQFDPVGSVFVVFRKTVAGDHPIAASVHGFLNPENPTKPSKLTIRRAIYGAIPSGASAWVDVTARVKTRLTTNQSILAGNDLAGTDPAPDTVKRLRVVFILNGRQQTNEVREYETLGLAPGAEIVNAIYGDLPSTNPAGSSAIDLTQKLSELVSDGSLNVVADNDLAGGDPIFGIPKELRVSYTLDGVEKTATIAENGVLSLGNQLAIGNPPAYVLRTDATGKTLVQASAPGKIEFTTMAGKTLTAEVKNVAPPLELSGPWDLSFPPNWGAPAQVIMPELQSWTDSADNGVKYFSGTAIYSKEIEIPAETMGAGRSLWLDLGRVKNLAEVSLNGKSLGILWKPPFRVEITQAAQPGKNKLEIKITNLWPNRLIGDEQLPDDREWDGKKLKAWPQWVLDGKPSPTGRFTFTTWHHWTKDDALLDSGLLGPVQVVCYTEAVAE
jgi:hypothetical protein